MERQVLSRKLLDAGDAQNAYLVAVTQTEAAEPELSLPRAPFHGGTGSHSALSANDPQTAYAHFLKISRKNNENLISPRARLRLVERPRRRGRWAHTQDARRHYQEARASPTRLITWADQRAALGSASSALNSTRRPRAPSAARPCEMGYRARAAELLYFARRPRPLLGHMMVNSATSRT